MLAPGPGGHDHRSYTDSGTKHQLQRRLNEGELKEYRAAIYKKDDGLGPGQYNAQMAQSAPIFSFGSRFNSSIRNKDHLRPRKVDGPGPGAYKLADTVKIQKRHPESIDRTTFGTSERQFSNLPKNTPAPNKYRPVHFTEASHAYSIARPPEIDINESKINK